MILYYFTTTTPPLYYTTLHYTTLHYTTLHYTKKCAKLSTEKNATFEQLFVSIHWLNNFLLLTILVVKMQLLNIPNKSGRLKRIRTPCGEMCNEKNSVGRFRDWVKDCNSNAHSFGSSFAYLALICCFWVHLFQSHQFASWPRLSFPWANNARSVSLGVLVRRARERESIHL